MRRQKDRKVVIQRDDDRGMRKRDELEEKRKDRQMERRSWSLRSSKALKAPKLCGV